MRFLIFSRQIHFSVCSSRDTHLVIKLYDVRRARAQTVIIIILLCYYISRLYAYRVYYLCVYNVCIIIYTSVEIKLDWEMPTAADTAVAEARARE